METIYALLIFAAVVFIIYQADRLIQVGFGSRGKRNADDDDLEDVVEAQEIVSDDLPEPIIRPAEPPNSTTKDEIIHDLAEENSRLLAEVDRLRAQIAVLMDEKDGDDSHLVE